MSGGNLYRVYVFVCGRWLLVGARKLIDDANEIVQCAKHDGYKVSVWHRGRMLFTIN